MDLECRPSRADLPILVTTMSLEATLCAQSVAFHAVKELGMGIQRNLKIVPKKTASHDIKQQYYPKQTPPLQSRVTEMPHQVCLEWRPLLDSGE